MVENLTKKNKKCQMPGGQPGGGGMGTPRFDPYISYNLHVFGIATPPHAPPNLHQSESTSAERSLPTSLHHTSFRIQDGGKRLQNWFDIWTIAI